MKYKYFYIFIFITFIIWQFPLGATEPVILTEGTGEYQLGLNLEYLEDKEKKYSIQEIMNPAAVLPWKKSEKLVPNFGFTNSAYWIRIHLRNESAVNQDWLLEIGYPLIDRIQFYYTREKITQMKESGDSFEFSQREIKQKNASFRFSLARNDETEFYLRMETESSMQFPVTVWSIHEFARQDHDSQYAYGIYYGIIIVMILYNLFVFFTIWDYSYVFYVLYLVSYAFFQMSLTGYAFEYLWPGLIWFSNKSVPFFIGGGFFFGLMFCMSFLKMQVYTPRMYHVSRFGVILALILMISTLFLNYAISIKFGVALAVSLPFIVLYSGFKTMIKGYRPARYFMIAWLMFLIGMIVTGLKSAGFLPNNFFTNNGIMFGSAFEIILLSLGLGDKINIMKAEKENAQREALDLKDEMNKRLEQQVKERTENLQLALEDLRNAQDKLVVSEKKTALMKIAAGIAHELNNPLNYILGGVNGFKRVYMDIQSVLNDILSGNDDPEAVELKKYFNEQFSMTDTYFLNINKGVQKSAAVIKELRGVTGVDGENIEEVSISVLIRAALEAAQKESKERTKFKNIKVKMTVPEAVFIELNNSLYLQVLRNVFMNAIYYSNTSTEPQIHIQARWNEDHTHCRITVENNGEAIPEKVEKNIFDGFVTTKDIGSGRGLGLFQSRSLLEYKGGLIELADNGRESGWVRFEIYIPDQKVLQQ